MPYIAQGGLKAKGAEQVAGRRISQPGDALEREADRVAETVMRMPAPGSGAGAINPGAVNPGTAGIHRKCQACAAGSQPCPACSSAGKRLQTIAVDTPLQRQAESEEEEELQLKPLASPSATPSAAPPSPGAGPLLSGSGQALPASARRYFEPRFGHDFGGVRVHTDRGAAAAAAGVNARAFTLGRSIAFAPGQYDPVSAGGRQLLAHELTHVVQQAGGSRDGRAGTISRARDNPLQRESWDVNTRNCRITRNFLVQLLFEDHAGSSWTGARKTAFRSNFRSAIESGFNNNPYVIRPQQSQYQLPWPVHEFEGNCPCPINGLKPQVNIDLVPDGDLSVSEDWEVDVRANPSGTFMTSSSSTSYGTLDEADNTAVTKTGSAPGETQVPTVHEFGHFIGLDHPGEGLEGGLFSESELSPGATEYTHTGTDSEGRAVHGPTDLMGAGSGLRPFYFDAWKEHLEDTYSSECDWVIDTGIGVRTGAVGPSRAA